MITINRGQCFVSQWSKSKNVSTLACCSFTPMLKSSHTNLKSVWHTCQSQQQRSNLQWFLFSHILSGQFCIPELNNVDITFGSGRVILGRGQDKTRHQASRSFESENGHKTHSFWHLLYFTLLIRLSWHRWLKKSVLLLILRVSSLF